MPDAPELTKRLDAIAQRFCDRLRPYEKIRKNREANPHGPTKPLELTRMQPDIEEFLREGVIACMAADRPELAAGFKTYICAELHRQVLEEHWPLVGWAGIDRADQDARAHWEKEKQRSIPVPRPWDPAVGNESSRRKAAPLSAPSDLPLRRRGPGGFPADIEKHMAIAEVVSKHASDWRTNRESWTQQETLDRICTDLDTEAENSSLYDAPVNWKDGKTGTLKGAKARGWADALKLAGPKLITGQIFTHLKMVRKHEANHN
jgi:hypothetical protein